MKVTLANGKVVEKLEPVNKSAVIMKNSAQLQYEDAKVRRKLTDLPDISNINLMSQILCYHLFGLSLTDIATITKLSEQNIRTMLMSYEFGEYKKKMLSSIAETDKEDVRDFIASNSKKAAEKVLEIMECGNPKYALPAAQDILDRAGHRPVDVVEHRAKMDNELRILFVSKNENDKKELEAIHAQDAEFTEISNNG